MVSGKASRNPASEKSGLRALGLHYSKKNLENRLARCETPVRSAVLSGHYTMWSSRIVIPLSAEGSGPPEQRGGRRACPQGYRFFDKVLYINS